MATLFDTLQQRLSAAPAPTAAPKVNIAEILQAKQGKGGVQTRGVGASSVTAGIAQDAAQQQVQQQAQQGQLQAAQLVGQQGQVEQGQQMAQEQLASQGRQAEGKLTSEALGQRAETSGIEALAKTQRQAQDSLKTTAINDKASLALQQMVADRNISLDNIFAEARMENKELNQRSDASKLEQKAFLLAMQDKSYLDELNRIGQERNLRDTINFDKEMQSVVFGQNFAKALDAMGFQAGQNAKERDVKKQLAQMSNGQIIQLANMASSQANLQSMYQGAGELLKEGLKRIPAPAKADSGRV